MEPVYINVINVHTIEFPEGTIWKAPTNCIKWTCYYHREMVEPDKYR